ncbi:unnamed protein product [Rotaria socialis]|uniref:Exostosin GT47 domain-containing protein n=1 Tax=Rotaria socialis TaxID=392032 RepID=A0A819Z8Z7_9BILA|nr:unnamed protein product [Rotaria socialis]CAF3619124.1 unnamed protein product [Rotaria socialis]CAF4165028.1 unnamed protein product [Rotaria socialis]CAF4245590.1 unnamed protein product [Rotaria socialis]
MKKLVASMKKRVYQVHTLKWCYTLIIVLTLTLFIIYFLIIKCTSYTNQPSLDCKSLCPYKSNQTRTHLVFDSKHFIQHYPEFICQSNFRNLADWVYGWPNQFQEYVEVTTTNGQHIAPCLPHGSIIYVSIWSIGVFFNLVYPHLINDFVLITGEGDPSSPDMGHLERADSKIIHWFGQNGMISSSKSKKFTHIPIGIQCYEMVVAIKNVYKQQNNRLLPQIYGDTDEPLNYILPIDMTSRALIQKQNLNRENYLLINFNLDTDGTGLRRHIWINMCSKKHRIPFVKCLQKTPGVQTKELSNIYSRNRQYLFWLSPRGNGIDCHRTWEALYLDAIPIVWNSSLNSLYEHLPVVIIHNHTEITENFLQEKLHEISMKKNNQLSQIYRFEKLRMAYWRRLILNKSRHSLMNSHIRTNRCWQARTGTDSFLSSLFS